MAVNGIAYETDRLKEAVKNSPNTTAPIELITKDDEHLRVVRIDYHEACATRIWSGSRTPAAAR